MFDFLVQKENSALQADFDFLSDIFNNYKYNRNSEKYKSANYTKVLDIRQDAGRQIDFRHELIKNKLSKKFLLLSDREVKKITDEIRAELKECQFALYVYGFAYFLEVMLQENFEKSYLSAVSEKIESMSFSYRELYSSAYSKIEALSKTSIETRLLTSLSAINKTTRETIAKIPNISKSRIDEALIKSGEKISSYTEQQVHENMNKLLDQCGGCVRPFIDNINDLARIYNEPLSIFFNDDTVYLGS